MLVDGDLNVLGDSVCTPVENEGEEAYGEFAVGV